MDRPDDTGSPPSLRAAPDDAQDQPVPPSGVQVSSASPDPSEPLDPAAEAEIERRVALRTRELEASRQALAEQLASERRRRQQSESDRCNREDLVALVSHELRGPLPSMISWSELTRGSPRLEDCQQALRVFDRNVRTMSMLVDDLLERASMLRAPRPLTRRPLELDALLERVAASFEPLRQQAELTLDLARATRPVWVLGDERRLEQVFLNLLSNAVKFTPPGGHLTTQLTIEGRQAIVRVADSGRGIAADQLARVFEASYQGDDAARSTRGSLGLGLAIVKHLVEAHGGTVEASSPGEDQGTTFVVCLPLAGA